MAEERSPKKPAHEVIVARLEDIAREIEGMMGRMSHQPAQMGTPQMSVQLQQMQILLIPKARADELAQVLLDMVIPEGANSSLCARLAKLDCTKLFDSAATGVKIKALIAELKGEQPTPVPAV